MRYFVSKFALVIDKTRINKRRITKRIICIDLSENNLRI